MNTPEFMTHERIMTGEEYVSYSDYLALQEERDTALAALSYGGGKTLISKWLEAVKERDEARHEIEGWSNKWECAVEMAARAEIERDEARKEIKELIYIGERAIALAEIDFENDKFGVVSELRFDLEKIKESAK